MEIETDKKFLEDIKMLGLSTKTYKNLKRYLERHGIDRNVINAKRVLEEDRDFDLCYYLKLDGCKELSIALKDFQITHNLYPNLSMQEIKFKQLMQTTFYELDLSNRALNALMRACGFQSTPITIESLIRETTEADLEDIRNIGKKTTEEIISKIKSLGLNLRPGSKYPDEWIEELKLRFVTKSKKVQPQLDINEIPEKYRKTYAIGAGVVAKQELEQNSRVEVSKKVPTKSNVVAGKPALPKVKISKQAINEMSDKQLLKVIAEDISIIESLEESFITKYRKDLIKIILANSTLDVDKRLELVELINNTQINTL